MRWDNLKVEVDESRALPGYREPATIRTFDAPEALDTRFYEVRSKSALNKVPKASRMPFRWTVNPYRGCSGEVRDIFMDWLRSYRPDLVPRYEELYARGAYVGKAERDRISALVRRGRGRSNVPALRSLGRGTDPITVPAPRPPREPAQTKLF